MSGNDFINSVMNTDTDLKNYMHNYTNENEETNPLSMLSIDSPYLDIEDISANIPPNTKLCYKALHINIHSVPDKIDKLKEILIKFKEIDIDIDFILLCETFLRDNISHLFNIPGYKMI